MKPTGSWSNTRRSFPPRIARRILRRDPDCTLAYPGCQGDSTEADHIVNHALAVAQGWGVEDINHPSNGQGVCRKCHQVKTAAERAAGRAIAAQTKPKERPTQPHPGLR